MNPRTLAAMMGAMLAYGRDLTTLHEPFGVRPQKLPDAFQTKAGHMMQRHRIKKPRNRKGKKR